MRKPRMHGLPLRFAGSIVIRSKCAIGLSVRNAPPWVKGRPAFASNLYRPAYRRR